MKIWQVPQTKDKPYGYRYSLVYIRDNKRIVGYDNGEGKGDHRHYRNNEHLYDFKGMDALIQDFYKDMEKIRKASYENEKNRYRYQRFERKLEGFL